MSLDGFIAGPNDDVERPLGDGGNRLHEWVYDLACWRERHGLAGGKTNRDAEVLPAREATANIGGLGAACEAIEGLWRSLAEEYIAASGSRSLLRRLPTVAEVANVATIMVSDRASAMTGTFPNVTCGSLVD
jgi:hypothetical protein